MATGRRRRRSEKRTISVTVTRHVAHARHAGSRAVTKSQNKSKEKNQNTVERHAPDDDRRTYRTPLPPHPAGRIAAGSAKTAFCTMAPVSPRSTRHPLAAASSGATASAPFELCPCRRGSRRAPKRRPSRSPSSGPCNPAPQASSSGSCRGIGLPRTSSCTPEALARSVGCTG